MAPTYTMSHHLWTQIYSSWRQTRQASPEPISSTTAAATHSIGSSYFQRSTSPKRSMDSDRGDSAPNQPMSRESSSSGWKSR